MVLKMIIIVSALLLVMKLVVVAMTYKKTNLTFLQWLVFIFGWVGMRPAPFETLPSKSLPYTSILIKGIVLAIVGFIFLVISTLFNEKIISNVFLLFGISLMLHFGILNISTAFYRALGVNVSELFRSPYKAKSLKEFWGKRWNIAFSEMTAVVAYRPLKPVIGVNAAMFVSFLLSGLLHEIAISVPVQAGYGLPMAYFGIHGVAMYAETRSGFVKKIIEHRIWSHVWVFLILILPLPLVFHHAFVNGVLIPLRESIFSLFHLKLSSPL